MKYIKHIVIVFVILTFAFTFTGCAGMSRTQQTTLSGAAVGAVGGGVLGAAVGGRPLAGAVIGAAVGALGGYIVGEEGKGYRSHRR